MIRSPDAPGRSRPLPLPGAAVLATAAAGSSCAQLVPGGPGESAAVGGSGWAGRWPEPPSGRGGQGRGVVGEGERRSAGHSPRLPGEWRHCLRANLRSLYQPSLLAQGRKQAPCFRCEETEAGGTQGTAAGARRGEERPGRAGVRALSWDGQRAMLH